MKHLIAIFSSLIFSLALPLHAQQISSLSGQYGCILNKNFGGYNVANIKTTNDGSTTGSNALIYFDFTNNKFEMSAVGLKTWGVAKIITTSETGKNGTISVTKGPLTNTFTVTGTFDTPGYTYVSSYNLMPVNGGTTLLLQQGTAASGDGEPSTGACNKI
jgi:hypothetical protein